MFELRGFTALVVFGWVVSSGTFAFADTPPVDPSPAASPQPDDVGNPDTSSDHDGDDDDKPSKPGKPDKPGKKAKKKHGELSFGGRVFVRGALVKDKGAPDTVAQHEINSARVKVKYRWHELRAEIEAEVAGKLKLKNAYVALRLTDAGPTVDIRAGNIKMPFSGIQLTSIWSLPMADRGLIDNVLVKRLQVAGRAVGAMAVAQFPAAWSPKIQLGTFQGVDDAGTPLAATASDRFGQDAVLRLSVKPAHGFELGVAGSARVGQLQVIPLEVSRGYAAELDATLELAAGPGVLRVWGEGMLGTSWLVAEPTRDHATFAEGRGIAGYRLGGDGHGRRYVEAYGLLGAVDPDTKIQRDAVVEATAGLTYGAWNAWRLQAEFEHWRVASNAPIGIVELGIGPATTNRLVIQLGARI